MDKKSKEEAYGKDFKNMIPEYSDQEILNILKKRKQYQMEAAELAIREAIKRGIINSEQDLMAKEYNESATSFKLFPTIHRDKNKIKIRKSIGRALLITGVIPVVWGVLKISESNLPEGIILILLGGFWLYASAQIMRGKVAKMVNLLFILLIASMIYVLQILMGMKGLKIMDYSIPVILLLLITYGLLFVKKLEE